ncbi:MAG: BCCT family transporter [Actinomycetaceae bacterium]|nr:BCCT family transporter [Actinomycetaceae bacterium]
MGKIRHIAFWPPVILFLAAAVLNFVKPDTFTAFVSTANDWLISNLAWAFSLGVIAMLGVVIWLMFSSFGNVRIGGRDAAPMLDTARYFSITLTSIIAIGILFWATAEPLRHFATPPESLNIEPQSPQAMVFSVSTLYTHWGFLPLAIYAIPSITFAFCYYNMKGPYSIGATLLPLLRKPLKPATAQGLDAIVMYSLIAGMAASLATGVLSISGGLEYLTGWQSSLLTWALVDAAVVCTFVISSVAGLLKGIRRLSETNTIIFIVLFVFVLVVGPTSFVLNLGAEAFAHHLANFFPSAAFTGAAANDPWAGWWTIFYWCNWLAWAPISGMFLGRISYGQTVRKALMIQFVAPAVFDIVWIGIWSGAALRMDIDTGGALIAKLEQGPEYTVYEFLSRYPLVAITIPIFIFVTFLSYVTGADAYTTTLGAMSTDGLAPENPEPPWPLKLFWGGLIGVIAWIMLASSGVDGIKILSNLGGLPALILGLAMTVSVIRIARNPSRFDVRKEDYDEHGYPIPSATKKATMLEEVPS